MWRGFSFCALVTTYGCGTVGPGPTLAQPSGATQPSHVATPTPLSAPTPPPTPQYQSPVQQEIPPSIPQQSMQRGYPLNEQIEPLTPVNVPPAVVIVIEKNVQAPAPAPQFIPVPQPVFVPQPPQVIPMTSGYPQAPYAPYAPFAPAPPPPQFIPAPTPVQPFFAPPAPVFIPRQVPVIPRPPFIRPFVRTLPPPVFVPRGVPCRPC